MEDKIINIPLEKSDEASSAIHYTNTQLEEKIALFFSIKLNELAKNAQNKKETIRDLKNNFYHIDLSGKK